MEYTVSFFKKDIKVWLLTDIFVSWHLRHSSVEPVQFLYTYYTYLYTYYTYTYIWYHIYRAWVLHHKGNHAFAYCSPQPCVCVCTRVYEVRNQSLASFLSLSIFFWDNHSLTLHSKLPGPSCLHFSAMPCLLPMCWQSELRPPYLPTEPSLSPPEWNFLKFNTFIVLSDSSRK